MSEINNSLSFSEANDLSTQLLEHVSSSIFGQEDLILETLCCFLAGGHILMTGAPGLAKTTLVRVFSENLGLKFGRVQYTPDLLPSDITGAEILNIDPETQRRSFEFSKGPIFVNLLLADEINRASPRTQSAMLEAMQEKSITVAGKTHYLNLPFMVFATQNPYESEGTFPLPEAQLDRFLLHTLVQYPSKEAELQILTEHAADRLVGEQHEEKQKKPLAIGVEKIRAMIAKTKEITIEPEILSAINELVRSTRPESEFCPEKYKDLVWYGAGSRAGLSFISVIRALALIEGVESVRWRHVRRMAKPVLRHRLKLVPHAGRMEFDEDRFIDILLDEIEARHHTFAKGTND